jgi:outer membrane biosynthesis protein TonB
VAACAKQSADFRGKVRVTFSISAAGAVTRAQAQGGLDAINQCVERAIKGARFARSKNGATVTYPFVFQPAD